MREHALDILCSVEWFWSVLGLSVLSALAVFWPPDAHHWSPTLLFVPLLMLLWVVLRQGLWAASVNVAVITCLAVIGTVLGRRMQLRLKWYMG